MNALKCVGYLIAAVAVITAIGMGGLLFLAIGVGAGLLLSLITTAMFVADALKHYIEPNDKSHKD